MPGMVRMSFGCYNNTEDVDRMVEVLERVARGDYRGEYQLRPDTGEYHPAGYEEPMVEQFLFA